jgi:hypothetical protein
VIIILPPRVYFHCAGFQLPSMSYQCGPCHGWDRSHLLIKFLDFVGFVVACWYDFPWLLLSYASIFVEGSISYLFAPSCSP